MPATEGTVEYAANLALGLCGQPEIARLDDQSTRARACRQFFGQARNTTLRRKWWNFATSWTTPAKDPVAGHGRLTIRYRMPSDCLRVRFVDGAPDDSWAIESGVGDVSGIQVETTFLVSNVVAPNVCYTRRVETVRLWDALFLDVFASDLASLIARKVGKDDTFADGMRTDAERKILLAGGVDSKEKAREGARPEPSYLAARRGFRNLNFR